MELYRRIIFKKTLINNNYKNLGIVNNLENIKIEFKENSNCSSTQSFIFDCKEILAVSVLPWHNGAAVPISMCTDILGNTVYVKTNTAGCRVFAILRV